MSFKVAEILFIAAVTLGIGFWQLWSVNREIARDRARNAEGEAKARPDGGTAS